MTSAHPQHPHASFTSITPVVIELAPCEHASGVERHASWGAALPLASNMRASKGQVSQFQQHRHSMLGSFCRLCREAGDQQVLSPQFSQKIAIAIPVAIPQLQQEHQAFDSAGSARICFDPFCPRPAGVKDQAHTVKSSSEPHRGKLFGTGLSKATRLSVGSSARIVNVSCTA